MFPLVNRVFSLARVGLVRAGLPQQVASLPANKRPGAAIVLVKNEGKIGKVDSTGYYPKAIVASGARRRAQLLDLGFAKSWAFIEAGTPEILADDMISSQELMSKLDCLLLEKFYGTNKQPIQGNAWPYICEVYPFENYFIFQYKGQKYRQHYNLDPIDRKVALLGGPQAVKEQYVTAGDAKESMPRSETGHHYNWAHTRGQLQTISMGGKHSELVTQIVRNWSNIHEAVRMYLDYARARDNKMPMRPAFYPVNIEGGKVMQQALAANGIDYYTFATWSAGALAEAAEKKTKTHSGTPVPMAKHAYVGDPKDPSTWHLPLDSPGRIRNAASRVNQTKGIPVSARPGVLGKIRKAEKHVGVEVPSKPTGSQKEWAHKKQVKSNMGDTKWSAHVTPGPGVGGTIQ